MMKGPQKPTYLKTRMNFHDETVAEEPPSHRGIKPFELYGESPNALQNTGKTRVGDFMSSK